MYTLNNNSSKDQQSANTSLMGTHRASNLERHLLYLKRFVEEQERRPSNIPNGRAQKRSVNRSLYGPRSGTSLYKRQSVAERTLTTTKMSDEQLQSIREGSTANQARDEQMRRVSLNNYPIPTEKGIYLQ